MEYRAARDQERQTRGARDQLGEARRGVADVLGVVDDEEELPGCQRCGNGAERVEVSVDRDLERLRDRRQDERWITERRKLDEHDAVRK